jgi:hypothetical protein
VKSDVEGGEEFAGRRTDSRAGGGIVGQKRIGGQRPINNLAQDVFTGYALYVQDGFLHK